MALTLRLLLAALLLTLGSATSWATTFYWGCTNLAPDTGTDANVVSIAFNPLQGNNNGTTPLLTSVSVSSGYAGASGSTNFGAACKIGAINPATSTYFELTVTPNGSSTITLTSIALGSRGTSTGPQALTVYSSIDSFATPIGSAAILANSAWALSTINFSGGPLIGTAGVPVTLRIYGSGGTGSPGANTANWRIDDISLTLTAGGGASAPVITAQPTNQLVLAGTTAIFAVSANGTAPLSYQWYTNDFNTPLSNGGTIGGATTNVLGITNVTAGNAGSYFVIITNALGAATSSPLAVLTFTNPAPILLSQPSSRTILRGATETLNLSVYAGLPITYQWQLATTNLVDGGNIQGSTTSTLTITNFGDANVGDYVAYAINNVGAVTSAPPATLNIVDAGTLVGWNFNGVLNTSNPDPSHGINGVASLVGGITGFSNSLASGLSGGMDNTSTFPNNGWGTSTYPAANAANKTAGIQFKVDTTGVRNLAVSFDNRVTATGSRYYRLQYTTNGTAWVDYPATLDINPANLTANANYVSRAISLVGFPGVKNNPNFGVRVVAEFESTAKYGFTNNNNYVGNTSAYGTGGTVSYDIFNITAEPITNASASPVVGTIPNVTILDTASPSNITFTISDTDTAAAALSVTAVSALPAILSSPGVVNNNDGTATITISPSFNQLGIVPVIVTVMDEFGNAATTWFNVQVNPGNFAPFVSALPNTNTLYNTPVTSAFTIGDDVATASSMTPVGTSSSQTLVPNANITFGGSGSNRTVTVTPTPGQVGIAIITVSVGDNAPVNPKTTTASYAVMVRPSTNVLLNDFFDYADGAITAKSLGLYANHSGALNQLQVTGSKVILNEDTSTEDVNSLLLGQPYTSNSTAVLYYSYIVTCTVLPNNTGTYISHFKDLNTGASSGFGGRVWASTTNAAAGKWRIGVGNGESTTNYTSQIPIDLDVNTPYQVVVKFTPKTGTNTTLWLNPVSEASPTMVATNLSTSLTQPNPIDVASFAFRQSGTSGGGQYTIDNLIVGKSFGDVVPVVNITKSGTSAVVDWSNPVYGLLASPVVEGPYTNVPAVTTPYTNLVPTGNLFYRLTNINNIGPL